MTHVFIDLTKLCFLMIYSKEPEKMIYLPDIVQDPREEADEVS